MEHIKLNKEIKEVLRMYSVPEEVINLVEEGSNIGIQTVVDYYEKQLKEAKHARKNMDKGQSQADFMEKLNKHRIVKKR